ncbi:(d)CMP kinase [Erythrobacter sp.]|jgi:cytidylate kinase|uniref:(d)CMP kinase n=1 Tax=Erythrobacter sp. TaxID=1042 RepID=UPI002EA52E51|nr:(d)CMP kinase [Erythrobacter sp.]
MIIAVDGPTASGKGTIARALAAHYGLAYLDTGLLYRAVGRQVALAGGDPDNVADARAAVDFAEELLEDTILRTEEVGGLASRVSVHPEVRAGLLDRQRAFAAQEGGAVLDGRDIGTVIAPDADVKLYITASVQARARRRWLEMVDKALDGEEEIPLAEIEKDIAARDARDIGRTDAPLRAAPDALVIDTTSFDRDQAFEVVLEAVEASLAERKG